MENLNEHDYESYIITIRRKHEAWQSTVHGTDIQSDRKHEASQSTVHGTDIQSDRKHGASQSTVHGTDIQSDRKNEQLSKKTQNISLNDTKFHDFEEFSAPSSKNSPNSLLNGSQQERESCKSISSPLPGVILEVNVKEGDTVKVGQVVAILEAMKMENEILSEYDGIVTSVNVSKEDNILEGTPIITVG